MIRWCSAMFFCLLTPSFVAADDDSQARRLFEAGAQHFDVGDYQVAQHQFERAYELSKRVPLLYNISLAAELAGNLSTAVSSLELYLQSEEARDRRPHMERLKNLRQRLAEQQAAAAKLKTEDLAKELEQLRAQVEAGSEPPELRVLPVVFKEGRRKVPVSAIVSFSAAGVGALMATSFGILALNKNRKLEDGCHAVGNCTDNERDTLRRYTILADVGLAVMITGAGLGTFFLVRDRKKARAREKDRGKITPFESTVSVLPYAGPRGGGLAARGSF